MSPRDHPGEDVLFGDAIRDVRAEDVEAAASVNLWCTDQLVRLGIPLHVARTWAGRVDWHQVANLVARGAAPLVALEIVQ